MDRGKKENVVSFQIIKNHFNAFRVFSMEHKWMRQQLVLSVTPVDLRCRCKMNRQSAYYL